MAESARPVYPELEHFVEVIVHLDESLDEHRRRQFCSALMRIEGIHSAEFCPLRNHLVLVSYDRERMNSREVLALVTSEDVHARLIGPV